MTNSRWCVQFSITIFSYHPATDPAQRPIIDWYFSSSFWMKSFALAASAAFSISACCGTSPAGTPVFLLRQGNELLATKTNRSIILVTNMPLYVLNFIDTSILGVDNFDPTAAWLQAVSEIFHDRAAEDLAFRQRAIRIEYGGFHSHRGIPIAGWLISWTIPN